MPASITTRSSRASATRMRNWPRCARRGRSDMLPAKDDGVGLITFNQPEKRNAMSMEMWNGLADILDEFSEDSSVSVVVMTGAGNKAFVSGADISQFEKNRNSADAQAEYDRATGVGRNKLINFKKPVIARIRGFCMGGGL